MALKWNCLDDAGGVNNSLAARTLIAEVASVADLGGGSGTITVRLKDANGRPHVPSTNDEAVIDIMLADSALSPESTLSRFGGIVGAGALICAGGGTAHVQVVTQEAEFTIGVTTTAARPEDVYVLLSQGIGSTYLVRAARRWAKLTLGVN